MHHGLYFPWIVPYRIVGAQLVIESFIFVHLGLCKLIGYEMNSLPNRGKALAAGVPSEYVVVPVILAPTGFNDRYARKQPPIQVVAIRRNQEICRSLPQRAIPLREKFLEPAQ